MPSEIGYNATTTTFNAFNAMSTIPASTWTPLLAVGVFIIIIVTIFLISKNFRRMLYGLAVSIPLALIGWGSWSIAKPAGEGDWQPFLWLLGIAIGVPVMILLGKVAEHLKIFKSIEDSITITTDEKDGEDVITISTDKKPRRGGKKHVN
jgi:hypothetical protein